MKKVILSMISTAVVSGFGIYCLLNGSDKVDKFWIVIGCADIVIGIIDLMCGQLILGIAMILGGFLLLLIN